MESAEDDAALGGHDSPRRREALIPDDAPAERLALDPRRHETRTEAVACVERQPHARHRHAAGRRGAEERGFQCAVHAWQAPDRIARSHLARSRLLQDERQPLGADEGIERPGRLGRAAGQARQAEHLARRPQALRDHVGQRGGELVDLGHGGARLLR